MKSFIKRYIKQILILSFLVLVVLIQKLTAIHPVFAQSMNYTNHSYHPSLGYYYVDNGLGSQAQMFRNAQGQLAVTNGFNTVDFWDKNSLPGAISPDLFGKPLYRKLSPMGDKRYWR